MKTRHLLHKSQKGVRVERSRKVALAEQNFGFIGNLPTPMLCCWSTMLRKRPYS
ncbi:MAG: hypothetical protein F6K31_12040 [Symploca sp. SIO2G7]|nr:hypothetical protein [Symploca sp. SIO2G7]